MKKLLIVVDMQNDFIDAALGTPQAQEIVEKAVEKIRNFDGRIIATLDTHEQDYMDTQEGKHLPVSHCIRDSDGWQLNERVREALEEKGYIAVTKPTFGSVELVEIINKEDEQQEMQIQLIGLCTDICVVSNALLLKTNFPEARISVDASCYAGVTPEKHRAALMTMESCQIEIL